jgi:hypothetical protein
VSVKGTSTPVGRGRVSISVHSRKRIEQR